MRKLATFAIPFAAAVFAAVYLAPQGWLLYAALICAVPGVLCAIWRTAGASARPAGDHHLRASLMAFGLAFGFLWTWGHDAVFFAPARLLDGQERQISATVSDWPYATDYGSALQVTLHLDGTPDLKAILYADGDYTALTPGDALSCTADLRRADLRYGEETEYYRAKGVALIAYADGDLTVTPAPAVPVRFWPLLVSKTIKETVEKLFPADTAGFMAALVTGDKSNLDGELYSALQRTGIAHVVAVSGLHVSFLAGLLTTLLGKRRRLGAAVAIGLLVFFAAVAGNTPSVVRAVYLQSALLLAPLLGRESDKITSLSAVLMLLLMWNPRAAAGVSLQLSFAAVAGIYLVTGPLHDRLIHKLEKKPVHRILRFVAGSLATSLGALIFTTPLLAYYFGNISLIAPVANLLTLWAVSYAFMGGLIAAVAGIFLPGVGAALAWVVSWFIRFVQGAALLLAKIPFAAVPANGYFGLWLGFVYLVLVVWLLWRGEKKRPLIALSACAITLCAALLLNFFTLTGGDLRFSALDVGQGAGILLSSQGQIALVDCGGGADNAGDVAADAVQSYGTNTLDYLILTHFHADHANGVARLMERLDVKTLIIPDAQPDEPLREKILTLAEKEGAQVRFVTDDTWVPLGETALNLYAPLGDGGANEEGLSVLATCGDFDALIIGDMNATVEKRLVKYGDLPDIEVLAVGHHGSGYSSSEELLLATKPDYAVISVGYNNYGHPAPETLERLAAAGCAIYRTDLHGTVTITANSGA